MAERENVQTFVSVGDALTKALSTGDRPLPQKGGTARTLFDLAESRIRSRCSILQAGPADIERVVAAARERFERGLTLCDSPIECMTFAALMTADWWTFGSIVPMVHDARRGRRFPDGDLVVVPQLAFSRVRMDFALVAQLSGSRQKIVAVECDGQQFHDPVVDAKRDEYLLSWGIKTFRVRGSDISRDVAQALQPAVDDMVAWRQDVTKIAAK